MDDTLKKLVTLLEHKFRIMEELIEKQEHLKKFLINPDWNAFIDMTKPQEALLTNLRQVQAAQDMLMAQLAQSVGVATLPNLKTLLRFVTKDWKGTINGLIERISDAALKLRELTRLSQVLNQSQWRFVRQWQGQDPNRVQTNTYNAQGYAQNQGNSMMRLYQEA